MKTRIIKTAIWNDSFFINLSSEAKLVFLFLITNNLIGMTGIYEMSPEIISFYTKIQIDKIEKILKDNLKEKIIYRDGWIVVKNAIKHNNYATNPKQKMAYMKEWNNLPEELKIYAPSFNDVNEYKPKYKKRDSEYEHRLIAEKVLKRKLKKNEVVHHIDGNPSNNNISNLAVMPIETHIKLHKKEIDLSDSSIILLSYYYDTRPKSENINNKSEIINNNREIESMREREKKNKGLDKTSLTREELWSIAMKTNIDLNDVMRKYYEILDLIEAGEFQRKYPKHKSLKLTLMNWLRLDVKRGYLQTLDEFNAHFNRFRNPKGDWGQDFFSRWEKARKEGRV